MYALCLLSLLSFVLSLMLTPAIRIWSIRFGLVDRPDHRRKIHKMDTPRTGGIAIMASYGGAYGLLLLLPFRASGVIQQNFGTVWRLLPAVAIIFCTGLLDDWLDLKPWQKLLGELAGAVWAYMAGVRILGVTGHATSPWIAFALTVAWLILCANAFNLIDGIDGLATGVGITATLTILMAGMLYGDLNLGLATAPLAGCLLGFLRYNFNPASIFLGDSGSLVLGFLLGAYGVIWTQKAATMLGLAAPAMALALPLIEVGLSILRRFLRNESIFVGDRGHIHHRLLDRGLTPRRVALLLYGAGTVGAVLSLLESVIQKRYAGLVILLFAAVAWVGIHQVGYVEFDVARRFLWTGIRPQLSAHVKLRSLERALESAVSVHQCWQALEQGARALGYSSLTARLKGVRFAAGPSQLPAVAHWQMRLNLPGRDFVNITQRDTSPAQPVLVMPFIEVVRRVLPAKLAELEIGLDDSAMDSQLANLAVAVGWRCPGGPRNAHAATSSDFKRGSTPADPAL
ncbi:MAG TPA: MraY family glycosyltransferase [Bryobacteraceae bacterium]|nr:MraY family glycosyltransferase [Bryobacteraceae bacterium]